MQAINPENYFILKDGTVIKDLYQLNHYLKKMPSDVFSFHVNAQKNDFYNWIKDIFKEKGLAAEVKKARTKYDLRKTINSRIAEEKMAERLRNMNRLRNAKLVYSGAVSREGILSKIKRAVKNV